MFSIKQTRNYKFECDEMSCMIKGERGFKNEGENNNIK